MSEKKGCLITIEGTEGVGKSTIIRAMDQALQQQGVPTVLTREPGGTPMAESIRSVLLSDYAEPVQPLTEVLLAFAGRCQHVEQVIKPALARGSWVISDRFTDASWAYQGAGRGLPREKLQTLTDWVQGDCVPDLTVLLDAPVEIGLERMVARGAKDRIEQEGVEFFQTIRQAYLQMAKDNPDRYCVIDAAQPEKQVVASMLQAVQSRWSQWL